MLKFIDQKQLYYAFLHGAKEVIKNKHDLNRINVFPIADGDTGSNLASTMHTIIDEASIKDTLKNTLESIADAALSGARGNSGIIFASYLNGMSIELENETLLSFDNFSRSTKKAVLYAYDAISNPIEGTMITVIKDWAEALDAFKEKAVDFSDLLSHAFEVAMKSLNNTPNQLKVLKKASVVDSGAKGFVCFLKGFLEFINKDKDGLDHLEIIHFNEEESLDFSNEVLVHDPETLNFQFCTEVLLQGTDLSSHIIKERLENLGDSLVVTGHAKKMRLHIHTNQPHLVFDRIFELGKVTYQKVDDMKKQAQVHANRRSSIAILTDSIADLPKSYLDDHQVHVIHLNILAEDRRYFDKLTVTNDKLYKWIDSHKELPTSSQPDIKSVENVFSFLTSYYDEIIVITVAKALSGTYSVLLKAAERFQSDKKKITVIDSKLNSAAQGLLVVKAVEAIEEGDSYHKVIEKVNEAIPKTKIYVNVKSIDSMVRSGRLSTFGGVVANILNLKPIVSLDENGKGMLADKAFSVNASVGKTLKRVKKLMKTSGVESYSIVHSNDLEGAQAYAKRFTDLIGFPPQYIEEISSITAISAGKKALAIGLRMK